MGFYSLTPHNSANVGESVGAQMILECVYLIASHIPSGKTPNVLLSLEHPFGLELDCFSPSLVMPRRDSRTRTVSSKSFEVIPHRRRGLLEEWVSSLYLYTASDG